MGCVPVCVQIWSIQQTAKGALSIGKASLSARPSARAKASGAAARASAGGGRAVVTGMEGLEPLFGAADIYPPYRPSAVQAMHSGGAGCRDRPSLPCVCIH